MGSRDANRGGRMDRPAPAKVKPEFDPALAATGYRLDLNEDSRLLRVVFYTKADGKENVVGYLVLNSPDAYTFASKVLHQYDILEGIVDHE